MQKLTSMGLLYLGIIFLFSSCFGYTVKTESFPRGFSNFKNAYPEKGWQDLRIYFEDDPEVDYEEIANIIIVGNGSASEEKLFKKMRQEAGCYYADAILFVERRLITRSTVNGFVIAANVVSAFDTSDDCYEAEPLEMGGEYDTYELEGIAIKCLEEEKE